MTIEQPAPVFATTKPSTGGPMSKLANHDSLTGLLCRSAFEIDKNSPAFLNQVSAVLGLGVLFCWLYFFSARPTGRRYWLLMGIGLVLLSANEKNDEDSLSWIPRKTFGK